MTENLTTTPVVELPEPEKTRGLKAIARTAAAFVAGCAVMTVVLKVVDSFGNDEDETAETSN